MKFPYQVIVAASVAGLLGACASPTALESQNQPMDVRQARLHFIRHRAFIPQLGSADIKVDGVLVGSLTTGSYLTVDRPPGPHKITVYGSIDQTGFETDINIASGISYYYELGPIMRINADMFTYSAMGITGKPLQGHSGFNSPLMFYSLEPPAGAASIAKLRG